MPYLSIVMPVYNMAPYGILARAIESVTNQTFQDFELIIIDDGSTDDSPQIIDSYARKDPRITVVHKKNAGCYTAYNDGLDRASGKYVTFFNSDDFADLDMYENLCERCETHHLDYLLTSIYYARCDFQGHVLESKGQNEIQQDMLYDQKEFRRTYELYKDFKSHNIHVYRRELIGHLRFQTRHYGEDCIFNLHFVPSVARALYCAQPFYHHCEYDSESLNASMNKFEPQLHLLFSERFQLAKKNLLDWGFYEGEARHIVARRRMDELLLQYRLLDASSCQLNCEEKKRVAIDYIDNSVVDAAYDLMETGALCDVLLRAKYRQLDGGNLQNKQFEGPINAILSNAVSHLCKTLNDLPSVNRGLIRETFMDTLNIGLEDIIV